jgi:O-antigen/teichoic acid export membrane protein
MIQKNKIIITYVAQIYSVILGLITLPLYIKILGVESFGLIGFFSALQAIFAILDIGFSSVVTREASKFLANNNSYYFALTRIIKRLFFVIGTIGAITFILTSDYLSSNWLSYKILTYDEVRLSIVLMGLTVVIRWISGYFKGIILGFEKLVWIGYFNILSNTLRFGLIIPIVYLYPNIINFFAYQLLTSVVEILFLYLKENDLRKTYKTVEINSYSVEKINLKKLLYFSSGIGLTSMLWVVISNADKILISKLVDLSQYGDFIAATALANGILILNTPISNIVLPRLTILHEEKKDFLYREMYKFSTQLLSIFSLSASVFISIYAKEILIIWLNETVTDNMVGILRLYAVGNSITTLTAMAYYLQFSIGKLKYHIVGSIGFLVITTGLMYIFIKNFGIIGSGYAWVISNAIYFILWIPRVHKKYLNGIHLKWMYQDILKPLIFATLTGYITSQIFHISNEKWKAILELLIIGIIIFISTIIGSSRIRPILFKKN